MIRYNLPDPEVENRRLSGIIVAAARTTVCAEKFLSIKTLLREYEQDGGGCDRLWAWPNVHNRDKAKQGIRKRQDGQVVRDNRLLQVSQASPEKGGVQPFFV